MKLIRFSDIAQVPVSHQDPSDSAAVKKVIVTLQDGLEGKIQMINWATLYPKKLLQGHSHADMREIFILMSGGAIATVDGKKSQLSKGDAFIVEAGELHEMDNPTEEPIEYMVIGIV